MVKKQSVMKSRKIAYCIPGLYNTGGMERVLTQKVNWLAEHTDWEITIITTEVVPNGKKHNYFPLNERIQVVELNIDFNADFRLPLIKKLIHHITKQQQYKKQLIAWLCTHHTDVCISMGGKEIEWLGKANVTCKKIAELHFVFNYREQLLLQEHHGIWWNMIGKCMTKQFVRHCRQMDKLVVLSQADKGHWEKAGVEHVMQISNPCIFEPNNSGEHDKQQILAVGRLQAEKGFDQLLEAWQSLAKQFPQWTLRICGEGKLRTTLETQIRNLGITKSVIMNGLDNDLINTYRHSRIFVLSSRHEAMPLALMEAMSQGTACIAMDCPQGPRELVEHEVTGLLVPNGNIQQLKEAMARLMTDEHLSKQIGEQAYLYALQHFGIDSIMNKWINILAQG